MWRIFNLSLSFKRIIHFKGEKLFILLLVLLLLMHVKGNVYRERLEVKLTLVKPWQIVLSTFNESFKATAKLGGNAGKVQPRWEAFCISNYNITELKLPLSNVSWYKLAEEVKKNLAPIVTLKKEKKDISQRDGLTCHISLRDNQAFDWRLEALLS